MAAAGAFAPLIYCALFLLCGFRCLDLLDHVRNYLEQVADNTVICTLEDRSCLIAVYCNDRLRILHTSLVLDGAGDTQSNVHLGMHGLAGLTNLMVGRQPSLFGAMPFLERKDFHV